MTVVVVTGTGTGVGKTVATAALAAAARAVGIGVSVCKPVQTGAGDGDDDLAAVAWTGDEVVQRRRLDIRLGWPLLVLVTVLLGCEWFLRRRHGLL